MHDDHNLCWSSTWHLELTTRPGQSMTWDHLGRLLTVTTSAGTTTYTYDPLDRLRTVTDPAGAVTRFRYTGLTTSAAQLLDGTGTVTRSIGNGWGGERLLDWVPGTPATDRRYHGTNAHKDTTWLADSTGAVLSALRYDPWGVPRSAVPAGFTPFRFQGSWHDSSTDLAWVVTRWYAPSMGTFLSEDSLLGEPREPDSRHLYAYGAGEPVGSWDPDGQAARGTCGGLGCVALPDPLRRRDQIGRFFLQFPGIAWFKNSAGTVVYVPRAGVGLGRGILDFMRWEITSQRLPKSRWWMAVNATIVNAALNAWSLSDRNGRPDPHSSAAPWYKYARHQKLDGFGFRGGTHAELYRAHQAGLWRGVRLAAGLLNRETPEERLVIWKVLVNVEFYSRVGVDMEWALGTSLKIARYPQALLDVRGPAARKAACAMWEVPSSSVRAYVANFMPKPVVAC